ncbi:MAG: hypothetical protein ACLPM3_00735 [Terracidiphilus sp.]
MDGLGPSTLYAQTAQMLRQNGCGWRAGIRLNTQLSLYAIHCHYRRRGTGRGRGQQNRAATPLTGMAADRSGTKAEDGCPTAGGWETRNLMAHKRRLPHRRWLGNQEPHGAQAPAAPPQVAGKPGTPWRASAVCPTAGG